jgi:HSP20 family protein
MMTTRSLFPTLDRLVSVDRELDRVFGEMWGTGGNRSTRRVDQPWIPAIDVAERTDGYVIAAELPGIDPATVDVSYDSGTLILRGTGSPSFAPREVNGRNSDRDATRPLLVERVSGPFERSIRLPSDIEADRIEASYENGLLWITVPKAESAKPRRITVKGAPDSNRVRG